MEVHLFKFHDTVFEFEEVYVVVDAENDRLHISPLNYSYNMTFSLTRNIYEQLEVNTQWGEVSFNANLRRITKEIIEELKL